MSRRWIVLGLLALGAAACRRQAAVEAARDAGEVAAPASPVDAGVPVVTEAQLDAYLRYQQAMLPVYDQLFRDLEALGPAASRDAGSGLPPSVRVVEARALAEEAARRDAGLSEAELAWLEPMVIDVISARTLAKSLDAQAQVQELEVMRDQVEGEVREGLENTLEELRAQQQEGQRLAAQRQKYGETNVDRLLAREAELILNHEAWMSRLTGGRR